MTDRNEALRLADSIHEMNYSAYMTAIANLNEKNRQQAEQLDAELCNREVLDKMLTQCIAERDQLQAELTEQARCNGMGAERELALMAECDRLREEVELYREFFAADQLVSKIMDEVSPGLTSPKGQEWSDRVAAAIARRCAAVNIIDAARTTHKETE